MAVDVTRYARLRESVPVAKAPHGGGPSASTRPGRVRSVLRPVKPNRGMDAAITVPHKPLGLMGVSRAPPLSALTLSGGRAEQIWIKLLLLFCSVVCKIVRFLGTELCIKYKNFIFIIRSEIGPRDYFYFRFPGANLNSRRVWRVSPAKTSFDACVAGSG